MWFANGGRNLVKAQRARMGAVQRAGRKRIHRLRGRVGAAVGTPASTKAGGSRLHRRSRLPRPRARPRSDRGAVRRMPVPVTIPGLLHERGFAVVKKSLPVRTGAGHRASLLVHLLAVGM